MSLGAYFRAVVRGPRGLAVAVASDGNEYYMDASVVGDLVSAVERIPAAPDVYLDWLGHMVPAENMDRTSFQRATQAAVAYRAISRLASAARKPRLGSATRYSFGTPESRPIPFETLTAERDGIAYQLTAGWEMCVASGLPPRPRQKPVDLRTVNTWPCIVGGVAVALEIRHHTFADLYLTDLNDLLRVCTIARRAGGAVLVGAA